MDFTTIACSDASTDQSFDYSCAIFSFEERVRYLKKYGSTCNSFAAMQPGMEYFDVRDIGYVAYRRIAGLIVVLSDPICKQHDMYELAGQFVDQFPKSVWAQISPHMAKFLAFRQGYFCSQMGSESKVALGGWTMSGKDRHTLRKTVNQARTQGITISEEPFQGQQSAQHSELVVASNAWLRTRVVKKELKFLVRPLEMQYRENCRYFYARKDGHVVGYICFDPIYRDGKVVAYAPNVSRAWAGFKRGLWYSMMIHALNLMKSEGVEYVDLGLFPARVSAASELESYESTMVHSLMRFIYEHCGWLYSCKGLDFAKSRFDGTFTKSYIAHRSRLPLYSIVAILKFSGVI
jgi:lysylphosphatidylglycerol synthetase-like protein (DUF2156 family)